MITVEPAPAQVMSPSSFTMAIFSSPDVQLIAGFAALDGITLHFTREVSPTVRFSFSSDKSSIPVTAFSSSVPELLVPSEHTVPA